MQEFPVFEFPSISSLRQAQGTASSSGNDGPFPELVEGKIEGCPTARNAEIFVLKDLKLFQMMNQAMMNIIIKASSTDLPCPTWYFPHFTIDP